jgi:methyl-accepting chemotaxis protein
MSSLRNKLLLYILSAISVFFILTIFIISSVSTGALDNYAYSESADYVNHVSDSIEYDMTTSIKMLRNAESTVIVSKSAGIMDRNFLPEIFGKMLEQHENIFSLWVQFEPDAWDGIDSEYANTEEYDETGNYAVWAYRDRETNKVIISTEAWGVESYQEDYYAIPAVTKKLFLTEPYSEEITDEYSEYMTTVSEPVYDKSGKFIGIAGIDISLAFLNSDISEHETITGGNSIIASAGGIILADNSGSDNKNISDKFNNDTVNSVSDLNKNRAFTELFTENINTGKKEYQIIRTLTFPEDLPSWTYIMTVPLSIIEEIPNRILMVMITISLIALILSAVFLFFVSSKITTPLVKVTEAAEMIADGDFNHEITVQSNDETGILAKGFNKLTDNLSRHIAGTSEIMVSLKQNTAVLKDEMKISSSYLNQIADSVTSLIMKSGSSTQSIENTSSSISEITEHIVDLKNHINRQSEHVIEASSAIEQMLANISSVTENIKKSSAHYDRLTQSSEEGKKLLAKVIKLISEINSRSEKLLETNTVITDIAEQTNLLSMNAAIEAAHAGDAGRGFAVVASEIRKLADNTEKKSKEIQFNLKSITDTIMNVGSSSKNAEKSFEEMSSLINTVAGVEREISFAMQEQSAGSNQIIISLEEMKNISETIRTKAEEITEGSQIILKSSEGLKSNNLEVKKGVNTVYENYEKMSRVVSEVDSLADKNIETAEMLDSSISVFKLKKS